MALMPEDPQPPSIIYTVVSSLLLKFRNYKNDMQVAMCASTSVVFTLGQRCCTLPVAFTY